MSSDRGSVALVTGGSRGIGRAVVEALLAEGWVVHFCSLSPESVERTLAALEEAHEGRVHGHAVDIRSQDAVNSLVEQVAARSGRIDCLVNNAGLGRFGPVDSLAGDAWREVVETNLNGAFYALRAVSRVMLEQGDGWIVNIASLAAKNAIAGGAAYNASKFGLLGLSEAAMLDLRHHGIRVTAILPGSVDTDFRPPSRRSSTDWMLAPEDVARAVLDLLRYPARALPSRIELRPSRPPRG
ncbi:MAG: SDR family oxidoreductase [Acidobacteriota bacterium]|nr:SDR family oxidoreductase [Acidobacteriota bacterium]MDH3522549.1 SDR family oxidoreductase [Acidobacteriota bacterium]